MRMIVTKMIPAPRYEFQLGMIFYQCNCLEILVGFSTLRQVMRMIVTKMIPAPRAEVQLGITPNKDTLKQLLCQKNIVKN
jgi:hypothetical protein